MFVKIEDNHKKLSKSNLLFITSRYVIKNAIKAITVPNEIIEKAFRFGAYVKAAAKKTTKKVTNKHHLQRILLKQ